MFGGGAGFFAPPLSPPPPPPPPPPFFFFFLRPAGGGGNPPPLAGHPSPVVNHRLSQLRALDLVTKSPDPQDRRRTLVALTDAGVAEAMRMAAASPMIGAAYADVLAEADADLFDALWRVHDLIGRGRLADALRLNREAAR